MKLYLTAIGLIVGFMPMRAKANESFERELICYRAIASHTHGGDFSFENGMVLVPGAKYQKSGFYLLRGDESFHCEFPAEPFGQSEKYRYYRFQLQTGKNRSTYVTYKETIERPEKPELILSTAIDGPNNGRLMSPNCRLAPTSEVRDVWAAELNSRIISTRATFDIFASIMSDRYKTSVTPDKHIDGLKKCLVVGGSVNLLTIAELRKFDESAADTAHQTTKLFRQLLSWTKWIVHRLKSV